MTYANIKNYRERGFTIVELLIVIIVIGILATLVLIAYNNVQGQARDTKRQSDASSLKDAIETYKSQSTSGYYPQLWSSGMTTAGGSGTAYSTGNASASSGGQFNTDISNANNYTNGTTSVSVQSSVWANLNPASTPNNSIPTSGNPNYIEAKYCPAGSDRTSATGVELWYWSESKKAVQPSTNAGQGMVTGTGCDAVSPSSTN